MPPIYDYRCLCCGKTTEEIRCVAMRDARLACNRCETPMQRLLSPTPGVVKNPAVEKKIRNK